jgi:hypothetical protein
MEWHREVARTQPRSQREMPRIQEDLEKIPGIFGHAKTQHLRFLKQGLEEFERDIIIPNVKINPR